MKKEQLLKAIENIDDRILERYALIDQELARKHERKRNVMRVFVVIGCAVILVVTCVLVCIFVQ